jgi:TRAP-type C4-dicarboxylate transport system permease small subunit
MTQLRLLSRLISLWALLGGFLHLIVVAITAINAAGFSANVIARTWGGSVSGLPGYEDAVTLLIGVAALAMFPYCQLHQGHAVVDVFMERAPRWVNRIVDVVTSVAIIVLALAMAVMMFYGMLELRSDRVETAVLGWPIWVFLPAAIVSCILWALAGLLQLLDIKSDQDGA